MMNNNKPTVAVLMSTYNGERFIREQIESILNQIDVDLNLFIRDDHSNDSTVDIIKEYEKKYPEKIFIKTGDNIGPGYSFMDLVQTIPDTFDFYAYSDQDDIWLKNKLICAVNKLQTSDIPTLYCSNQTLYVNGQATGNRHTDIPNCSLKATLCRNDFSGCTMVFNNSLEKILRKIPFSTFPMRYRLHDTWTCLLAWLYGTVIYDENSYILYRIHENNTVGLRKRTIKQRIERLFKSKDGRNLRSKTAQALLINCNIKNKEDEDVIKEFAYYKDSIRSRMRVANDRAIRSVSGENKISLGIKLMLNLF